MRAAGQTFRYDYVLIATVLLLTLLGLVTLYSASYLFALNQPWRFGRGGTTPLVSNLIACAMMIFLFPALAFGKLDILRQRNVVLLLVLATIILNLLPFISFFQKSNFNPSVDARRWIFLTIGGRAFSFQPSELIKLTLPIYLAYILDKNTEKFNKFFFGPMPAALVTAAFCFLTVLQSNFSEVVLFALIGFGVCFAAGLRLRWFALAAIPSGFIAYSLTFGDAGGRWHQRLYSFFNPGQDMLGARFQVDMSLEAIRSGGFFGRGIGQGVVKTRIPEVHGDFVFASFAEEFGFFGVFLHLALIALLAGIVFFVARRGRDRFEQLLAFGLVAPIVLQTFLNVAVVANIVPTTGVALPFVSSGGSSMLVTLCASAILVNIVRRNVLSPGKEAGRDE